MRSSTLCLWFVTLSISACGGRYESNPKEMGRAAGAPAASGSAGANGSAGASNTGTGGQPQECPCLQLAPTCAPDQQLVVSPDACCPRCEPSPSPCEQQRAAYAVQRDQVIAQFADFKCMSDSDCVLTYDPSNCAMDCSFVIHTAAGRGVIDRLVILGQHTCTGVCVVPNPAGCQDLGPARCVTGQCRSGPAR
jgi:hypothetical protein